MWYEVAEDASLKEPDIFRLLQYHQRAEWNALARYGQHLNIQSALMTALLGGGALAVAGPWPSARYAALVVPVVAVLLRKYTIQTLDRYYRRFLEAVACSRKLEWMLGLDLPVKSDRDPESSLQIFTMDTHLDVERRWSKLLYRHKTSASWVTDLMGRGHNAVAWRMFRSMFAVAAFLPLVSWALGATQAEGPWTLTQPLGLAIGSLAMVVTAGSVFLYRNDSAQILKARKSEQVPHTLRRQR